MIKQHTLFSSKVYSPQFRISLPLLYNLVDLKKVNLQQLRFKLDELDNLVVFHNLLLTVRKKRKPINSIKKTFTIIIQFLNKMK